MQGKADYTKMIGIIAIVALVALYGLPLVGINLTQMAAVPPGPGISAPGGGIQVNTQAVTLRTSAVNAVNGTAQALNGELFQADGQRLVGETSITAAGASLSTSAPNTFDGYVMLYNDPNFGTDRGVNLYSKRMPLRYSGKSGDFPVQDSVFGITSVTYTVYDDGTAEATPNITVGSGQKIVTTEIKMSVTGTDAAFGNPDPILLSEATALGLTVGERPVGVCFNSTTAGMFEQIRPNTIVKAIPVPGILTGRNVVNCDVLDTKALIDRKAGYVSEYRYGITIESRSGQNPGILEEIRAYPLDLSWYLNDNRVYVPGWEDVSNTGVETEIGLGGEGNTQLISMT